MKYVKMLALAAVAAGALMAFFGAATASATTLCSTTVEACPSAQKVSAGTVLDWSIPSERHSLSVNTKGEEIDSCTSSTIKWKITNAGSAIETPSGSIEELTWGSCTFPTSTITKGGLEVHRVAGTSNGIVTATSKSEWTINTVFFGSCIYGFTKGTSLGELTEGNPAVLHINTVIEKFAGSSFACLETDVWTATYTLTSPATTVSVSAE